jgi:hypothetical protein
MGRPRLLHDDLPEVKIGKISGDSFFPSKMNCTEPNGYLNFFAKDQYGADGPLSILPSLPENSII